MELVATIPHRNLSYLEARLGDTIQEGSISPQVYTNDAFRIRYRLCAVNTSHINDGSLALYVDCNYDGLQGLNNGWSQEQRLNLWFDRRGEFYQWLLGLIQESGGTILSRGTYNLDGRSPI